MQYRRKELWRTYTATVLGMIGRMLGGENWTLASYVEMAYPEMMNTDTRSAAEVIEDLKKRFTEE